MESNYRIFRIIVIITVSTLVTIFISPVDSTDSFFAARSLLFEPESPAPEPDVMSPISSPANYPTEVDTESPAPTPEALDDSNSPANSPTEMENDYVVEAPVESNSLANAPAEEDIESPAPSPEVLAESNSLANAPAEEDVESPAPSPEASAESNSLANAPAEEDIESPAPSPEVPAESNSLANAPAEEDLESPAPSPEVPAESNSLANAPAEEDVESPAPSPEAPAGSPENSSSEENSNASSGLNLLNTAKNLLNPELKTICSKTDNPLLCESSVSPLLTAQLKPDASSVLVLAIEASVNTTKAALETIKIVAATDCQELFDDAITNLEDAVKAVKSRDIGTLNANLSAAMTDYGTCNDGFEESGEPNPLGNLSDKLTKMVSNCLALSTLIK